MKKILATVCVSTALLLLGLFLVTNLQAQGFDGPPGPPPGGAMDRRDARGPMERPAPPPGMPRGQDGMLPGGMGGGPGFGPAAPGGYPGATTQPGPRGPGGFGGGMVPTTPFDQQRAYLELVERFNKLSHDPEAAGVAAVISATDIMRQQGDEATIAYFNKLLPQVKNEAVKCAIRLHLIDLYRKTRQVDKALALVEQLIKDAPGK